MYFRFVHILVLLFLTLAACKPEVEDLQPKSGFETGTGPLPEYRFEVLPGGSTIVRFDSIAEGGNFTVSFTPLAHGRIRALPGVQGLEIALDTGNWHKDSTNYTISKNAVQRKGWLYFVNKNYVPDTTDDPDPEPVDTACSALPNRFIYLDFNTNTLVGSLFPDTFRGRVDSVRAWLYAASISLSQDRIQYLANPATQEQMWAFDTVYYKLKALNRKCFTGKLIMVIGDTCEPQARPDVVQIPVSGTLTFPETLLTQNDRGCNGQTGSYITRTQMDFDYGNYKIMPTTHGILVDTLIGGNQHYKYTRANPTAREDGFYYYFRNNSSGRTSMAWVRLRLP